MKMIGNMKVNKDIISAVFMEANKDKPWAIVFEIWHNIKDIDNIKNKGYWCMSQKTIDEWKNRYDPPREYLTHLYGCEIKAMEGFDTPYFYIIADERNKKIDDILDL